MGELLLLALQRLGDKCVVTLHLSLLLEDRFKALLRRAQLCLKPCLLCCQRLVLILQCTRSLFCALDLLLLGKQLLMLVADGL